MMRRLLVFLTSLLGLTAYAVAADNLLLLGAGGGVVPGPCLGVHNGSIPSGTFDPSDPAGWNGYQLVFDSEFNDFGDFDLSCQANAPLDSSCTNPQGKNWYLTTWTFPNHSTPAGDLAIVGGILSIRGSQFTGNWQITTAATKAGASHGGAPWQQGWNGALYTGGWYAEARVSQQFRDSGTNAPIPNPGGANAHATFWAYAMDHLHPGDNHFIEIDMLDGMQGTNFYQTNMIDWTGTTNTNVPIIPPTAFNQVNVQDYGFPANTFTGQASLHIIGELWVPATASTQGYLQNYFDGVPTSKFMWDLHNPGAPQPATGNQRGSVLDVDHVQVILGADPPHAGETASYATEYVDWVHIWQLPAAATASGNASITPQANFKGATGSCP